MKQRKIDYLTFSSFAFNSDHYYPSIETLPSSIASQILSKQLIWLLVRSEVGIIDYANKIHWSVSFDVMLRNNVTNNGYIPFTDSNL